MKYKKQILLSSIVVLIGSIVFLPPFVSAYEVEYAYKWKVTWGQHNSGDLDSLKYIDNDNVDVSSWVLLWYWHISWVIYFHSPSESWSQVKLYIYIRELWECPTIDLAVHTIYGNYYYRCEEGKHYVITIAHPRYIKSIGFYSTPWQLQNHAILLDYVKVVYS